MTLGRSKSCGRGTVMCEEKKREANVHMKCLCFYGQQGRMI